MRRKPTPWQQSEKDYILANYKSTTIADMARKVGRPYRQVDGYLYRYGLYKDRKTIKRPHLATLKALEESEVARVYLAGIVDGEGTITIQRTYKNYYRPYLQVANTSVELLDWLKTKGFYSTFTTNSNGRPYWRIALSGYGITDILKILLPYLIIKKKHAELTIEFINIRQNQKHKDKPTDRMKEIYTELKKLNMRGVETYKTLKQKEIALSIVV